MNNIKDNTADQFDLAQSDSLHTLDQLEQKVAALLEQYAQLKSQHDLLERQYRILCQAEQRLRDKQQITREKLIDIISTLKTALSQTAPAIEATPLNALETEE